MKKFYVASALENAAAVKSLVAELTARGWKCTYDWSTHGSVQDQPERWKEVAEAEAFGVFNADAVIVIQPGGRGTHVELGIAIGRIMADEYESGYSSRQLHMIGDHPDPRTCVFYHAPGIRRHASVEAFLAMLDQ